MLSMLEKVLQHNGLIAAFALVGIVMGLSMWVSKKLTFGHVHSSAIAIMIGLVLTYWGSMQTGDKHGLADLKLFGGIGLMGGAILRDLAIVTTAFEMRVTEAHRAGMIGAVSLLLGTMLPFIVGACAVYAFDYTDPVSVTTIGAGAVTYIIGPITGAVFGAISDTVALSITTGLVRVILAMVDTPFTARVSGLDSPYAAMVFGRLADTVNGVSAGLAVTDQRLVPYGSPAATSHTGLGCLLGPPILFLAT